MTDHLTTEQRSWNMSRIKSKHTKPEIIIRSLLHKMGLRFRLHRKDLPGKPDIVLQKYNTVIFCHGCFWHQHENCVRATIPKTNTPYWKSKFQRNVIRFEQVQSDLIKKGWKVIVIWECETKDLVKLKDIIKIEVLGV